MHRGVGNGRKHIVVGSLANSRIREIGLREPVQQLLHYRNYLTGIDDVTLILLVRNGVVHGNLLLGPRKIALRKISGSLQCSWHAEFILPLRHSSRFIVVREKKEEFVSLSIEDTRDKNGASEGSSESVEAISAS